MKLVAYLFKSILYQPDINWKTKCYSFTKLLHNGCTNITFFVIKFYLISGKWKISFFNNKTQNYDINNNSLNKLEKTIKTQLFKKKEKCFYLLCVYILCLYFLIY